MPTVRPAGARIVSCSSAWLNGTRRTDALRTIGDMNVSDPDHPRIRASDDDRNRVVAALSEAFSTGRLDYAEFDERTQQVYATRFRDELHAPLSDLFPDPAAVVESPLPAVRPDNPVTEPTSQQVTREQGGDRLSFSLMGGSEKTGNWLCAPSHVSVAIMGGNDIDLRHSRLGAQTTTITAIAVMGEIEIYVPEDVRVVCDGVGIMGGFEVSTDDSVAVRMEDLPEDAPVIRVTGVGLMGGVGVTRISRDVP